MIFVEHFFDKFYDNVLSHTHIMFLLGVWMMRLETYTKLLLVIEADAIKQ